MTSQNIQLHPRIVVGALIYNDAGEIFLAKSYKWGDQWVVPGGHLDWGETLVQGIAREVREETGLELSQIEFIGFQEAIFPPQFNKKKHMLFMDYIGKAESVKVTLNDELQEFIWVKPKDALGLPLNSSTKHFIEKYIAKLTKQ